MENFQRTVIKALLPHIILTEAANQPIHGYALINIIRKKHGVYFGPSTIYPVLNDLERQGFIQSTWNTTTERPRKVYTITNKGRLLLGQTSTVLGFVNKMLIEVKAS
jgi:DNA-binding PadR family transcriptional regulator